MLIIYVKNSFKYLSARIWRFVFIMFIDLVEFVQALQSLLLSDAGCVKCLPQQSKHAHSRLLVRLVPTWQIGFELLHGSGRCMIGSRWRIT